MGAAALLDNVLPPLTRVCIRLPRLLSPKRATATFVPSVGFKVLGLSHEGPHPKLVLCWIFYSLSLTVSTHSRLSLPVDVVTTTSLPASFDVLALLTLP